MAKASSTAMKSVVPVLIVTETCDEHSDGAVLVSEAREPYFSRQVNLFTEGGPAGSLTVLAASQFNLFPFVLCGDGSPWAEACLFILNRLESTTTTDMSTFDGCAQDLAAYRRFIEDKGIDWCHFPLHKKSRPTYLYNSYLILALEAGELEPTTLNRRMGSLVAFYRWLETEGLLCPENRPWDERDAYIKIIDGYGFERTHQVKKTDLTVHVPRQNDPFVETIQDGGCLRPLPRHEQEWLLNALSEVGNTEMTLIHLMGMLTGARLQSVCTMRVHHVSIGHESRLSTEVKIPIGPGTEIDTKGNKRMVLHIPVWFYQALHTYANSERAKIRRKKAGGENLKQYLFLTQKGNPFYSSKEERRKFNPSNKRRYGFEGGAVGTFIREVIRPLVAQRNNLKSFVFKYHDTRATFGMNLTDAGLAQVEAGLMTLGDLREYVKTRMGHDSCATTDSYLNHRKNLKLVRSVIEQYETHLKQICQKAMDGDI